MLSLRLDSSIPLADQVVAGIRQAIASGELVAEDPLPTVRQLAADLGINMNTVARAYRALESSGLVLSRRGRGTVVRASLSSETASDPDVHADLASRLREVVADLRLAGFDRLQAESLLQTQLAEFWPVETSS